MPNYSEEDRVKMYEIKQVVKSFETFGVDILSLQKYVDDNVPLDQPTYQIPMDNIVNKHGKTIVSEFIKEAIRNREKGESVTYDVKHQTLFKGKRTERVSDDDDCETAWGHYYKFLTDAGFTNIDEV